ncbi:MAG: hypothetical protein NT138_08495 [Planctomycetales bacterium]|nr:hypothetical protein [Planctomycetales bacterium]
MRSLFRIAFAFILAAFLPQHNLGAQVPLNKGSDPATDELFSRYKEFVNSIRACRFTYTMTGRRSTGSRNVEVIENGHVKVDVSGRLYHRGSVLKASIDGGASFRDQGTSEHLLNSFSRLEVDSPSDLESVNDPSEFSVNLKEDPDGLELARVFVRLPLSVLWGYFPIIDDDKNILDIDHTHGEIGTANEGSQLRGFSMVDGSVVVKVWFDLENPDVPRRLEWTRSDATQVPHGAQVGGLLEVIEVARLGSKGIPSKVAVTLTEAGGTFSKQDLGENAKMPGPAGPDGKVTVPATEISYNYVLEGFQELDQSESSQFVLSRPIPNGAYVVVVGKENRTDLFWKDGKTWRLPPDIDKEIAASRFLAPKDASWKMPLLVLMNVVVLSCILAIKKWRKKKA